jgi:hypothetical protein
MTRCCGVEDRPAHIDELRGVVLSESVVRRLARALYDKADRVDYVMDWDELEEATREYYCGLVETVIAELLCSLANSPDSGPTATS